MFPATRSLFPRVLVVLCRVSSKQEFVSTSTGRNSLQCLDNQGLCLPRVLVVSLRNFSTINVFVFTCTGRSVPCFQQLGICFHVYWSFYAVFPAIRSSFSRVLVVLRRVSTNHKFVFTCTGRNSMQCLDNQGFCLPHVLVVILRSVSTIKVFVYHMYWS